MTTRNEFGLYEEAIDYNDPRTWLRSQAKPVATIDYSEALVWHEAAHAIVGHRLGMTVQFIDMSGLLLPTPLCGLDEASVPEEKRTRARGIAALAGPIGEVWDTTRQPSWRQDGEVARAASKDLGGDLGEQMNRLIEWSREAKRILDDDLHYPLVAKTLEKRRTLTGDEFRALLR